MIMVLKSILAVAAGMATVLILVFGSVSLFAPQWADPAAFPTTAPALSSLIALEAIAGLAGAFVAAVLAPRAPAVHGWVLGGFVLVLNLLTVLAPPWPLLAGLVVVALVPLQTWAGVALAVRLKARPVTTRGTART